MPSDAHDNNPFKGYLPFIAINRVSHLITGSLFDNLFLPKPTMNILDTPVKIYNPTYLIVATYLNGAQWY